MTNYKNSYQYLLPLFLIGMLGRYRIDIIGILSFSELLIFILLLFQICCLKFYQPSKIIISLFVTLILLIVFSDYYNETQFYLGLRGVARLTVPLLIFLYFSNIFQKCNFRNIRFYYYGGFFSAVLNFFFELDSRIEMRGGGSYVDFAYRVSPLVLASAALLAFLASKKSRYLPSIIFAIASAYIIKYGTRSSASYLAITSFIFLIKPHLRSFKEVTIPKVLKYSFLIFVCFYSLLSLYTLLGKQENLSERAQLRFNRQASTTFGPTPYGLLLAGRPGLLYTYLMITDKPLLGHGSWPNEGVYKIEAFRMLGKSVSDEQQRLLLSEDTRGTGHSILFGSMAMYGIFVALPLGIFLFFHIRLLIFYIHLNVDVSYFLIPFLLNGIIAFLITPLGSSDRMRIGMVCALYAMTFLKPKPHFYQ